MYYMYIKTHSEPLNLDVAQTKRGCTCSSGFVLTCVRSAHHTLNSSAHHLTSCASPYESQNMRCCGTMQVIGLRLIEDQLESLSQQLSSNARLTFHALWTRATQVTCCRERRVLPQQIWTS